MHLKNKLWTTLFYSTQLMFIYIHKYMYKMYYVKVLGNPFDDNFCPFLLNLF
jgi:hypothetical protein